MRILTIFTLLLLATMVGAQTSANPVQARAAKKAAYPTVEYTTVRAFNMNKDNGKTKPLCTKAINDDGQPCHSVTGGTIMTKEQTQVLLNALNSKNTYGESLAKCFIPHHAFVFYNKANKPVAQVAVCFMCTQLEASPEIPMMPTHPLKAGLSKRGIKALKGLCNAVGLKDCDK